MTPAFGCFWALLLSASCCAQLPPAQQLIREATEAAYALQKENAFASGWPLHDVAMAHAILGDHPKAESIARSIVPHTPWRGAAFMTCRNNPLRSARRGRHGSRQS